MDGADVSRLSRHQRWLLKQRARELQPRGCPQPIYRLPPENPSKKRQAWWAIDSFEFTSKPLDVTAESEGFPLKAKGSFELSLKSSGVPLSWPQTVMERCPHCGGFRFWSSVYPDANFTAPPGHTVHVAPDGSRYDVCPKDPGPADA